MAPFSPYPNACGDTSENVSAPGVQDNDVNHGKSVPNADSSALRNINFEMGGTTKVARFDISLISALSKRAFLVFKSALFLFKLCPSIRQTVKF